jgi:hypothetical protein
MIDGLLYVIRKVVFWTVIVTSFFCLAITSGYAWLFRTHPVYPADKCASLCVVFGLPLLYLLASLVVPALVLSIITLVVSIVMTTTCLYVWSLTYTDD